MLDVPDGLRWLEDEDGGAEWLAALPSTVETCLERWGLALDEPFPVATEAYVSRVTRADGSSAVLKIAFPGRENTHEADALRTWNGDGAVRLFEDDREANALLIERCVPGTPLTAVGMDAALAVAADLLPRLWVAADEGFMTLVEESAWWAGYLPRWWTVLGEPFERELLDAALEALRDLPPTQGELVLVNQDLHADNILQAERQPWLVIDPKPLIGEREFGVVPIVRGRELGAGEEALRSRFERLTADLSLDRERVRGWGLAQTLAWSIDEQEVIDDQVEIARWFARLRT
jgi:streptomycin 6-kinase